MIAKNAKKKEKKKVYRLGNKKKWQLLSVSQAVSLFYQTPLKNYKYEK